MIIATHLNFILHFNFPTYQVIVQANGFNIVIICPAFEDICWVSEIACLCVCACEKLDVYVPYDY